MVNSDVLLILFRNKKLYKRQIFCKINVRKPCLENYTKQKS